MSNSTRTVRILLTAAEAYPALERGFLAAQSEVWASFAVFDLRTRLMSAEGQAVGRTWFDLLVHTLNRGVALHLCVNAFDPILHPAQHQAAVVQLRLLRAALQAARDGAPLHLQFARHPAQVGGLLRLAMWPRSRRALSAMAARLNALPLPARNLSLREMEGLARHFHQSADGRVRARLLALPRLFPVTHHQKLAVIDRRSLYIGGLDLDSRSGLTQPGDPAAHDVQLLIEGPVVAEAQQHLESFLEVIAQQAPGPKVRRLLRTVSRPWRYNLLHFGPQPWVQELRSAHLVLARRATSFLYLESPSFQDRELALALAEAARRSEALHMILILPALSQAMGPGRGLGVRLAEAMQDRALGLLRKAFGPRLFIGSPLWPEAGEGAPLVHVNAKVSVFDDKSAIVSSANLTRRGLRWNTEAGVYLAAHNDVLELRHRVMAHWLPDSSGDAAYDPQTAVAEWRRLAWGHAAQAAPAPGLLLPHDFARAAALGRKRPIPPADLT